MTDPFRLVPIGASVGLNAEPQRVAMSWPPSLQLVGSKALGGAERWFIRFAAALGNSAPRPNWGSVAAATSTAWTHRPWGLPCTPALPGVWDPGRGLPSPG